MWSTRDVYCIGSIFYTNDFLYDLKNLPKILANHKDSQKIDLLYAMHAGMPELLCAARL